MKHTPTIVIVLLIALPILLGALAMGLLLFGGLTARVETDTDASHYARYMGAEAEEEYQNKWDMDETIFPAEITADMEVTEYLMAYYNPWDAQYLSYLTVTYDERDYDAEVQRLERYPSTPYVGYYSVTGFADSDDPIAIYADSYNGFVYAIHTPGAERSITYVELIFCNYFMDLDYSEYIPAEYLPVGFDATVDNPYQELMMGDPD